MVVVAVIAVVVVVQCIDSMFHSFLGTEIVLALLAEIVV